MVNHNMLSVRLKAVLSLALGGGLFAASSFLVAYSSLGPDASGFWRMMFSIFAFLVWLFIRPPQHWRVRSFWLILLAGAFLAIDLILWHRSIYWIGPGIAAILTNFMVFFLILFGWLMFKERLSLALIVTIIIAFISAIFIVQPEVSIRQFGLIGGVFGLASSLAYALSLVVMKFIDRQKSENIDPDIRVEMLLFSVGAMLVMLCAAIITQQSLAIPSIYEGSLMFAYGFLVQFIGWLLIVQGSKYVNSALVGLILLSEPVLAFVFSSLLGFGTPTYIQIIAAFIAMIAIYYGSRLRNN